MPTSCSTSPARASTTPTWQATVRSSSGPAFDGGNGALENFKGNNTWTGAVTLGNSFAANNANNDVNIEVDTGTDLLLSGTVTDVTGLGGLGGGAPFYYGLNKTGPGRLILTNSGNTFIETVYVDQG